MFSDLILLHVLLSHCRYDDDDECTDPNPLLFLVLFVSSSGSYPDPVSTGTVDSGLNSMVMASNNEFVLLPVNEPTFGTKRKSQIQTYLEHNNGSGVQHLALKTDDIFKTMREMKKRTYIGGKDYSLSLSLCLYVCLSVSYPCHPVLMSILTPPPFSASRYLHTCLLLTPSLSLTIPYSNLRFRLHAQTRPRLLFQDPWPHRRGHSHT